MLSSRLPGSAFHAPPCISQLARPWLISSRHRISSRVYATLPPVGDGSRLGGTTKPEATVAKPELPASLSKTSDNGPKSLLEKDISSKEQRKADWAIMKKMVKYIWPKVRRFHL